MTPSTARNNIIGILCLLGGSFVFSLQDSAIKAISGNNAVTLAIVFRAIVSMPILLGMAWAEGGLAQLKDRQVPILLLRGLFLLISYTSYFMAFPALPLAEAVALYFMVPLIVTMLAGPLLHEHVGWKSWAAVLIGIVAGSWFRDPNLGGIIAAAMIINMFAAALAGILIPLVLDRLKIDPAVASAVFVTTVTDRVGFFAFLGLATWWFRVP